MAAARASVLLLLGVLFQCCYIGLSTAASAPAEEKALLLMTFPVSLPCLAAVPRRPQGLSLRAVGCFQGLRRPAVATPVPMPSLHASLLYVAYRLMPSAVRDQGCRAVAWLGLTWGVN